MTKYLVLSSLGSNSFGLSSLVLSSLGLSYLESSSLGLSCLGLSSLGLSSLDLSSLGLSYLALGPGPQIHLPNIGLWQVLSPGKFKASFVLTQLRSPEY